jgi:hypothetical protein
MNEMIIYCHQIYSSGIEVNGDTIINTVLYADDQRALYILHNTTKQFGMKIALLKSKVVAFKGQVPVKSKTVIDNTIF